MRAKQPIQKNLDCLCVSVLCVTLGVTGILMDLFCLFQQGATGVPEERWPTKTSSGTRVNVPAKLVTCCSRCALLSWWFMYVVLLLTATRVSCFTFHLTSEAFMGVWQVAFRSVRISISVSVLCVQRERERVCDTRQSLFLESLLSLT